jgi:hypothetical protein
MSRVEQGCISVGPQHAGRAECEIMSGSLLNDADVLKTLQHCEGLSCNEASVGDNVCSVICHSRTLGTAI